MTPSILRAMPIQPSASPAQYIRFKALEEAQRALEAERMTRHPADDICTITFKRERDEAQGKLEAVDVFMEHEFSNEGICLVCRAPKANHEEMSPSCWVMLLDRILSKEGSE